MDLEGGGRSYSISPRPPLPNMSSDPAFLAVRTSRVHSYCFTWFNYTPEIEALIQALGFDYCIYGHEICPTTGRPHLQGYLYWVNKKQGSALIKALPGCILRVCYGNTTSNYEYCRKEGKDVVELGTRPMDQATKGKAGADHSKKMWANILKLSKAGDFDEIEAEYPSIFFNSVKKITEHYHLAMARSVPKEHHGEMPGVWIIGPPGAGKSGKAIDMALEQFGCDNPYMKNLKNDWWTNYKYQNTVILEDLDPTTTDLSHDFKVWIDRYKCNVRVHYGMIEINPRNFIVTSNYDIKTVFKGFDDYLIGSMERRFPIVIHMTREDGEEHARKRICRHEDPAMYLSAFEIFGDEPV